MQARQGRCSASYLVNLLRAEIPPRAYVQQLLDAQSSENVERIDTMFQKMRDKQVHSALCQPLMKSRAASLLAESFNIIPVASGHQQA